MGIGKRNVKAEDDLGFGNQAITQRIINSDGSINVRRTGQSFFQSADNFHRLLTMKWGKFWLMIFSVYLSTNLIFAGVYFSIGPNNLEGADASTPFRRFLDDVFFSAQTISTVGYGHISPKGIATNTVAAFESMMGLLAFALATGLLYGRFSRPSAKILYSDRLLVSPYKPDAHGLMFRLANKRRNLLIDLVIDVTLSYNEMIDGKPVRKFIPLELERNTVQLLTLSWTIVHPLNENSPLKYATLEDLEKSQATFNVILRGFDDTFSQTVQSRTSYQYNEIIWGAKFKQAFYPGENGQVILDLNAISDFNPAELPA